LALLHSTASGSVFAPKLATSLVITVLSRTNECRRRKQLRKLSARFWLHGADRVKPAGRTNLDETAGPVAGAVGYGVCSVSCAALPAAKIPPPLAASAAHDSAKLTPRTARISAKHRPRIEVASRERDSADAILDLALLSRETIVRQRRKVPDVRAFRRGPVSFARRCAESDPASLPIASSLRIARIPQHPRSAEVAGVERLRLHADLTILAKFGGPLARARAVPLAG
jgi:hypothetical protein